MLVSELGNCILKCKKPLAAFVALCILLCNLFVGWKQSYTAETYIKYLGDDAKYGIAADGSHINPYEIKNSFVVKRTLDELGVTNANHEEVRRNITITPIYSTDEEEKHASWIENFSDYAKTEENRTSPVYYAINFKTDIGEHFATSFLNTLVEQYRTYYVENHAHSSNVLQLPEKAVLEFDYFETANVLESKIKSNIEYLQNIEENDFNYRSADTGYSVKDLVNNYKSLLEKDLASVSVEIRERGLTKAPHILHAALENKAENATLSSKRNAEKAASHKELMTIYSTKNKEYTWGTSDDETNQVREDTERDKKYNHEEMTYDKLMLEYIDYAADSKDLSIDNEYNLKYMSFFGSDVYTDAEVDQKLAAICKKYNELHETTQNTLNDYNHFKSSRYISHVSGICAEKTMSELIYYAATVILSLGLGIIVIIFADLQKKKRI